MLEATQLAALENTLCATSDVIRAAYELGATNVHIFAQPDHLRLAIVADDAFAEPFAQAYPEYPLVTVPASSDKSKPMFAVFVPITSVAEEVVAALQGKDAVALAETIVSGSKS